MGSEVQPTRRWILAAVAGACALAWVALLVWTLGLDGVLSNAVPIEGDQVSQNWWLHEYATRFWGIFRGGKLFGWTDDFGAGQPFGYFYFPLPATMYSLLEAVIGAGYAVKTVQISGLVLVAAGTWRLARQGGGDAVRATLITAAVALGSYYPQRYPVGADLASTLIGEYSYAWGFGLGLLALGRVIAVIRGEGGTWRSVALLMAASTAGHINAAFVIGAAGGLYAVVLAWRKANIGRSLRTLAGAAGCAGGLLAFWLLPIWSMRGEIQGNNKHSDIPIWFWFPDIVWRTVAVVGIVGLVVGIWRRSASAILFASLGVGGVLLYETLTEWHGFDLWSGRAMPLVYVSLLAGVGELLGQIARSDAKRFAGARAGLATLLLFAGTAVSQTHIEAGKDPMSMPGTTWRMRSLGTWQGLARGDETIAGRIDELVEAVDALDDGRILFATSRTGFDTFGAIDLNGELMRRGAGSGGASTFFHEGNRDRYSVAYATSASMTRPSTVEPGRKILGLDDFAAGVETMRQLGIRYYIIHETVLHELAQDTARLRKVASVGTPSDGDGRFFEVYEIDGAAIVEGLRSTPGVIEYLAVRGEHTWSGKVRVWLGQLGEERYEGIFFAETGPDAAQLAALRETFDIEIKNDMQDPCDPSEEAEVLLLCWDGYKKFPAAQISDIKVADERITFRTDSVGTPVIVRMGYSPQWRVRGGVGAWHGAPHAMIVIPTEEHVEVYYQHPRSETVGFLVSAASSAWLVFGAVRRRNARRAAR